MATTKTLLIRCPFYQGIVGTKIKKFISYLTKNNGKQLNAGEMVWCSLIINDINKGWYTVLKRNGVENLRGTCVCL